MARETRLEGEESQPHQHRDRTYGTDIEAFRNTYDDDVRVSHEKASDWGKVHTSSDEPAPSGSDSGSDDSGK